MLGFNFLLKQAFWTHSKAFILLQIENFTQILVNALYNIIMTSHVFLLSQYWIPFKDISKDGSEDHVQISQSKVLLVLKQVVYVSEFLPPS